MNNARILLPGAIARLAGLALVYVNRVAVVMSHMDLARHSQAEPERARQQKGPAF